MPKTVIVNSTPIIALSSIDRLDLLKDLYGTVIIPNAVKCEIEAKYNSKAHNQLEATNDWICIRKINNVAQKQTFRTQLHDGEVEVIILGQELIADILVMDDYSAREYAKYLGFNLIGIVGILLLAKSRGFIHEVRPLIDRLIENGIFISTRLYADVIKIANE